MNTNKKRTIIDFLPIYGCIATGIIYATIGVIAILSFLKIRQGGADESSMLAILQEYVIGKILIWIILAGTICYIIWRFYETIKDPYAYGRQLKGIILRSGIALSTIADMLIVYAAIRVTFGISKVRPDGQPVEERQMVGDLLQESYGKWLVIAIGCVYLVTAVVQLLYGITRGYKERVNMDRFSGFTRHAVNILAWSGYFGRGIILGITGFFFAKAGITEAAIHVVNTDKAFDFIGDHIGHFYFLVVAVATICYGLFMFVQAMAYDTDKD